MHVEIRHFFIFENVLRTTKNFRNHRNFFSSSVKYYFLQKVRYIQWNFLTLSSVAYTIFSKKPSWFLFLNKSEVQKSVQVITCFSYTFRKQKFKSIQVHSWTPVPFFQCYLFLSVWCVCFVYLHHFYQYYLCFAGRT